MTALAPANRPSAAECANVLRGPLTGTVSMAAPTRRFRWRPTAFVTAAAVAVPALIAGLVLALSPPAPAVSRPAVDVMTGAVAGAGTTPSTSSSPVVPAQMAVPAAPPAANRDVARVVPQQPAPQQPAQQQSGDQGNGNGNGKAKNNGNGD
jgi:hypothetical protein